MEMRICICLLSVSRLMQVAIGLGSAPLAKCAAAEGHRAKWPLKQRRRWFSARASLCCGSGLPSVADVRACLQFSCVQPGPMEAGVGWHGSM